MGEDDFEWLDLYFGGVLTDLAIYEVNTIFKLIIIIVGDHLLLPFLDEIFIFLVVPAILIKIDIQLLD